MYKSYRKKIFYVPGIISLIILSIVFICLAKIKIKEREIKGIRLFVADTNFMKERSRSLFKFKYVDINFTGNDTDDNIKLAFAQVRIREILTNHDTINGLHFIFNDNSTYGTFVKTIDVLQSGGAEYYIPYGNNIWFYNIVRNVRKTLPDNFRIDNGIVVEKPKAPFWKRLKQKTINAWNSSWQIISLFFIFVITISIFKYRNISYKK